MIKLTEQQIRMMDRAIEFAPKHQILILGWWSIFSPKKAKKFIDCVESGMTWFAAYTIAKTKE